MVCFDISLPPKVQRPCHARGHRHQLVIEQDTGFDAVALHLGDQQRRFQLAFG